MRLLRLVTVLALLITAVSCVQERKAAEPELPPTPVLTSDSFWAVVNKPYLKILVEPETTADVEGILRRGDLVQIISKISSSDGGRGYWLEIRQDSNGISGWIADEDLDVYDSEAQARTAGAEMNAY